MTRELDKVIILIRLLLLLGMVGFCDKKFFYDLVVETVDVRIKWVCGLDL